jgi:PST family polysaccharide transporter
MNAGEAVYMRRATTFSLASTGVLALANLIESILPLLRNIALTRLIAPDQVGLVFSLTIVISAVEVATDFGLPIYAVRKRPSTSVVEAMKTVQTLALVRSSIIALILVGIAPLVARAFHAPEASGVYALLALVAVLRGFENLGVKEAMREYVFWREAVVIAGSQLVSVGVTIGAASVSPVFTCVLWGMIAGAFTSLILSHLLSPRAYRVGWNSIAAAEAVKFGSPLVVHGTAFTLNLSDRLLIGALLGPVPLAVYSVAYGSAMLPRGILAKFLTTIIIPVFVRADARQELNTQLLDTWAVSLSLIGFYCGLSLCLFGNEAISFIFGSSYNTSRFFMCLAGLSFFVKTMMLQPVPVAYQVGNTWLVTFGSLVSAAAIVPGAATLLLSSRLEMFLMAMTLAEMAGLLLYTTRASREQRFTLSLSYFLTAVPSSLLGMLCAVAFAAPDLSVGLWLVASIVVLALSMAFFAKIFVSFNITPRVIIPEVRGSLDEATWAEE